MFFTLIDIWVCTITSLMGVIMYQILHMLWVTICKLLQEIALSDLPTTLKTFSRLFLDESSGKFSAMIIRDCTNKRRFSCGWHSTSEDSWSGDAQTKSVT